MPETNVRLALLDIAQDIGRHIRTADGDCSIGYPQLVEVLGDVEDKLTALALRLPERSTLCVRPLGYLPSRHPKALANTLAGHASSIHPALRPRAQTEDFTE